uniref:rRNA methyltransferase 2, mitochondrial n=1 Tax=Strigamia maritima TaxID=126957 RepID=T1IRJ9_STRMM
MASYLMNLCSRNISTSASILKNIPNDVKGTSSNAWISRQLNDPYVKWAKMKNYRARSAFKLLEIDDKHRILKPGQTVIECGAAPGAWTQVCVERINSDGRDANKATGRILALDINYFEPVVGAEVFSFMDLMRQDTHEKIKKLLNNDKVHVVLSDMAPSIAGIRSLDNEVSRQLFYAAFNLSVATLRAGGTLVIKLLGEGGRKFEDDLFEYFYTVKHVKPPSSRKESPEIYYLARKFKGLKNVAKKDEKNEIS